MQDRVFQESVVALHRNPTLSKVSNFYGHTVRERERDKQMTNQIRNPQPGRRVLESVLHFVWRKEIYLILKVLADLDLSPSNVPWNQRCPPELADPTWMIQCRSSLSTIGSMPQLDTTDKCGCQHHVICKLRLWLRLQFATRRTADHWGSAMHLWLHKTLRRRWCRNSRCLSGRTLNKGVN